MGEVDEMKARGYSGIPPQVFSLLPPQQQAMVQPSAGGGYMPMGQMMAPPQTQMYGQPPGMQQQAMYGMQQPFSGGVRIPPDVARAFVDACRQEYCNGVPNAVGNFLNSGRAAPEVMQALEQEEDRVRNAGDRQGACNQLARQWGV